MTSNATTMRGGGLLAHAALLYRHPEQLRVVLEEFVRDAVGAAEPCLVALPAAHLEAMDDVLGQTDLVRTEDITQIGRNPARLIPLLLDWIGEQGGACRVVSEALWPGRRDAETAECLRHEALLNVALADQEVGVLCPYDAEHLGPEVLAGAELTHPHLIDEAGPRPSMTYGDPIEVARGASWPQAEPAAPISELGFDGDLARLRHALAADPLLGGLDPSRRSDFVFAFNEAANNAVRHGDGLAHVRLWRADSTIVGEIITRTTIDDPLAGRRTPAPEDADGRGLWLINQLCDLVEVRSGGDGASVRMHVELAA